MSPSDVDRAQDFFHRHGPSSVGFGRVVPGVRSVISMPAGVARMPIATFLFWSAVGTLVWSGVLLAAGYLLQSQYEQIKDAVEWITRTVIAAMVVLYRWRVARFGKS